MTSLSLRSSSDAVVLCEVFQHGRSAGESVEHFLLRASRHLIQHVDQVVVELREGDPRCHGNVHPLVHAVYGGVAVASVHGWVV